MEKITILALHLGYGGIEKCICNLANSLCSSYSVKIVSVYKMLDKSAFSLDDRVQVEYLIPNLKPNREEWKKSLKHFNIIKFVKESFYSVVTLFQRRSKMIKAIKKSDADIIISTRILFNNWLGKYGRSRVKKIGWEHNHHHGNMDYVKKMVKSCQGLDSVVFVSDSLRSYYKKQLKDKEYKCKAVYIPNSLDYIPDKCSKLNTKDIVSIGRFSREKGFVDLIDVFYDAYKKNPKLRFHLIGDGTQKNMIVDKIYQYNLQDKVKVYGFLSKDEINKILNKSSLYVMTSYTESFGIVLLEAMSFGIPCIAFSSAEGACDLIKNDVNGYLIDNRDIKEMSSKIVTLMNNTKERNRLGDNARNLSLNYSNEVVKDLWLKLFK